jgi:hypothetical protein
MYLYPVLVLIWCNSKQKGLLVVVDCTGSYLIFTILDFGIEALVNGDTGLAYWLIGKLQNCNFRVISMSTRLLLHFYGLCIII